MQAWGGEGDPEYGHYWLTIVSMQRSYITSAPNRLDTHRVRRYALGATRGEAVMLAEALEGSNAGVPRLMWDDGLMPVEAYTNYVLSNVGLYPNLASRLELPRFAPFLERALTVTVPEVFEFDRTVPHDDLGRGCLIQLQGLPEETYTVLKYRDATVTYRTAIGEQNIQNEENILHVCEGATRLETWGE